jgi:glutaredoxin
MSRTRIVKGNIYEVVEEHLNYYSKKDIVETASLTYTENSETDILYGGNPGIPPVAEIDITADAIVHFRPMKNWKGKEYGFDWLRIKDTGLFGDDLYSDLVGIYDKYPSADSSAKFTISSTLFTGLKGEYSNPVYNIPWLLKDKKSTIYYPSWLCVEKNKEIKLSLKVQIRDKKNLPTELVIAYDKTICEITTSLGKGSENEKSDPTKNTHYAKIVIKKNESYKLEDEIKLKIKEDITTPQILKVFCDGNEAGYLKLYNNKVKRLNIVCIRVKANIGNGEHKGSIKGKTELENYLKQSLIKTNIVEEDLNILTNIDSTPNTDLSLSSISDGNGINVSGNIRGQSLYDYLDEKLKAMFPNLGSDGKSTGTGKYDKFLRLYFFSETAYLMNGSTTIGVGGIGTPIGAGRGVMFSGITDADVAHEAMHAIALGHSFGTQESVSTITPYLFKYKKTENVMDYAHLDNKDKYSTWKWQWDKLRNFNLLTE